MISSLYNTEMINLKESTRILATVIILCGLHFHSSGQINDWEIIKRLPRVTTMPETAAEIFDMQSFEISEPDVTRFLNPVHNIDQATDFINSDFDSPLLTTARCILKNKSGDFLIYTTRSKDSQAIFLACITGQQHYPLTLLIYKKNRFPEDMVDFTPTGSGEICVSYYSYYMDCSGIRKDSYYYNISPRFPLQSCRYFDCTYPEGEYRQSEGTLKHVDVVRNEIDHWTERLNL